MNRFTLGLMSLTLVFMVSSALADDAGNTKGAAKSVRNGISGRIEKAGDVDWFKQWYKPSNGYTLVRAASGTLTRKGGFRVFFYRKDGSRLKVITVRKPFSGQKIRISHDHFFAKVVPVRSGAVGTYNINYKVFNAFQ